MKRSKERKELLANLCQDVQEYITDKVEINGLTYSELLDLCVSLTAYEAGIIFSSLNYGVEGAKDVSELIGKEVCLRTVRAYLVLEKKKKLDEERDNTSKDPA